MSHTHITQPPSPGNVAGSPRRPRSRTREQARLRDCGSSAATLRAAALLCVLVLAPSLPAMAGIYSAHDPSISPTAGHFVTGDGNVTIDSESDLAWLDLTLTTDLSYDDVVSQTQTGGPFAGYRLATPLELASFWQHAGITVPNDYEYDESPQMGFLQSVWGATAVEDQLQLSLVLTSLEGHPGYPAVMSQLLNFTDEFGTDFAYIGTWEDGSAVEAGFHDVYWAPALVRPASEVAEPSSLMLVTLGLLCGFGWWRQRARRIRC